jgi:hypothetical protein
LKLLCDVEQGEGRSHPELVFITFFRRELYSC